MSKQETVNSFAEGLIMDFHPLTTPNTALTNCLNGTMLTMNGNEYMLQNDMGNGKVHTAYLPSGYVPVGIKEHGGIIYVASLNPQTNKGQIGSFPSPQQSFSNEQLSPDEKSLPKIEWSANQLQQVYEVTSKDLLLRSGDQYDICITEPTESEELTRNDSPFTVYLAIKNKQNNFQKLDSSDNLFKSQDLVYYKSTIPSQLYLVVQLNTYELTGIQYEAKLNEDKTEVNVTFTPNLTYSSSIFNGFSVAVDGEQAGGPSMPIPIQSKTNDGLIHVFTITPVVCTKYYKGALPTYTLPIDFSIIADGKVTVSDVRWKVEAESGVLVQFNMHNGTDNPASLTFRFTNLITGAATEWTEFSNVFLNSGIYQEFVDMEKLDENYPYKLEILQNGPTAPIATVHLLLNEYNNAAFYNETALDKPVIPIDIQYSLSYEIDEAEETVPYSYFEASSIDPTQDFPETRVNHTFTIKPQVEVTAESFTFRSDPITCAYKYTSNYLHKNSSGNSISQTEVYASTNYNPTTGKYDGKAGQDGKKAIVVDWSNWSGSPAGHQDKFEHLFPSVTSNNNTVSYAQHIAFIPYMDYIRNSNAFKREHSVYGSVQYPYVPINKSDIYNLYSTEGFIVLIGVAIYGRAGHSSDIELTGIAMNGNEVIKPKTVLWSDTASEDTRKMYLTDFTDEITNFLNSVAGERNIIRVKFYDEGNGNYGHFLMAKYSGDQWAFATTTRSYTVEREISNFYSDYMVPTDKKAKSRFYIPSQYFYNDKGSIVATVIPTLKLKLGDLKYFGKSATDFDKFKFEVTVKGTGVSNKELTEDSEIMEELSRFQTEFTIQSGLDLFNNISGDSEYGILWDGKWFLTDSDGQPIEANTYYIKNVKQSTKKKRMIVFQGEDYIFERPQSTYMPDKEMELATDSTKNGKKNKFRLNVGDWPLLELKKELT